MDPVTAIGLASAIVAFVTFTTDLIKGAIKIHESLDGALDENRSREAIAAEMKRFAARLLPPDDTRLAGEERGLCMLAAECRDLSGELVTLLGRIKPKDAQSKSQGLWSALKNKVHEKERADLEQRLDYCRSQLDLQLAFLNKTSLDALVESVKNDAAQLERLRKNVEGLRRGVQVASISSEAQEQIRRLVDVQENAFSAIVQDRILRSLEFEGMHGRFDMVDEAHCETFRWILDESDESDKPDDDREGRDDRDDETQNEVKCAARERFASWLSSGEGIFHISGKLGSGKSTLMKYLSCHARTGAKLAEWAGGRNLVMASFFFWRPGSPRQKSLDGLCRSLLHDVLQSRPELIPEVLPELWRDASASPWQIQTKFLIQKKDVRAAFTRLIGHKSLYAEQCFCFFIDGLDEYQATASEDYKELVELLSSWTRTAPRGVKLCVSSREYNVFMNIFSADNRLRLHELTRFDMESYARARLEDISEEGAKNTLVKAVVDKAEGIFLWVALVVKQMRDQLEDGADPEALMQAVDLLPDELDSLYEHILKSLSKADRKKAYQTFAILPLTRAPIWDLPVSMLAYSFLDKFDSDKTFAEKDNFLQVGKGVMSMEQRIQVGSKRMNGCCKGLVEPTRVGCDYTHRSIPEFLENKAIKEDMESSLAGFSAAEALSQLILAEIRLEALHFWDTHPRDIASYKSAAMWDMSEKVKHLVSMRQAHSLDHTPFTFLRALDFSMDMAFNQLIWRELATPSCNIFVYLFSPWGVGHSVIAHVTTGQQEAAQSRLNCFLPSALHICGVIFRDNGYPTWWAANGPVAPDSVAQVVLLAYATFTCQNYSEEVNWSTIDALLDRGLLTRTTRTRLILTLDILKAVGSDEDEDHWFHGVDKLVGVDEDSAVDCCFDAVPEYGLAELSVWQHYLIGEWLFQQDALNKQEIDVRRRKLPRRDRNNQFVAAAQRFLIRGEVVAEARFTVTVSCLNNKTIAEFRFWDDPVRDGKGATTKNPAASCWVTLPEGLDLGKVKAIKAGDSAGSDVKCQTEPIYTCSLVSWVEGLEEVSDKDKDELLRLIDKRNQPPEEIHPEEEVSSTVADPRAPRWQTLRAAVEGTTVGYILLPTLVLLLALFTSLLPVSIMKDAEHLGSRKPSNG